jgi:hypothetical protein
MIIASLANLIHESHAFVLSQIRQKYTKSSHKLVRLGTEVSFRLAFKRIYINVYSLTKSI